MKRKLITFAALAMLIGRAAPLQGQDATWVHLHVVEDGVTQIQLNLPMSMVGVALESIRAQALAETDRTSDGMQLAEVRRMWEAMRDAGDAEFLNMQDGDETMRVFREGDRVFVEGGEGDESSLRIEMPVEIADAILAGEGDPVAIEAAIRGMVSRGETELVLIRDGDATVRLWADNRNTQDE